MKKLIFIFCVCGFFTLLLKNDSFSQDVKFKGLLQDWIYLQQEKSIVAGHPGVETSVWGFRLRRARLMADAAISENFEGYVSFEFADAQRNLLDFRIRAKIIPEFNIAVGQFTTPASMWETSSQPSDKIHLFELSDISIKLSNNMGLDNYRDVGIEFYGAFNFIKYRAFVGNGNGRLFYANNNILNRKFGQGLAGLRLDIEPVKGLLFGGHISSNVQDSVMQAGVVNPVNTNKSSWSVNLNTDDFGIPGLFTQFGYGKGIFKIFPFKSTDEVKDDEYSGFSVLAGYKITPVIHLVGRYDTFEDKVPGAVITTSKNYNMTFGINYLFFKDKNEIAKVSLTYHSRKEDPTETDNNIILLWMQFRF